MDTTRRPGRIAAVIGVAATLVAGLTGCTGAVSVQPAPSANAAACAAVQVRLPDVVDQKLDIRATNAQSTAAWGTPTAVLYHCGVAVPTVSDLPCFTQSGVDWIRDARKSTTVYTTFGRSPAVQVVIDDSRATANVLQELGDALDQLPKDGHRCLDPSEVQ
jgi:hypothetical protein